MGDCNYFVRDSQSAVLFHAHATADPGIRIFGYRCSNRSQSGYFPNLRLNSEDEAQCRFKGRTRRQQVGVCQKQLVTLTYQYNITDVNTSASSRNPLGTVMVWCPQIVETLERNDLDFEIRHGGLLP